MSLDADVAKLLAVLKSHNAPALSAGTVATARKNYNAAPNPQPDDLARVEDHTIPGPDGDIPVRVYASSREVGLGVVMFFHGGGWVLSSVDGHDHMARRLAVESGALVVSVDYRLAPEYPFPAPHDDCWAATHWMSVNAAAWGGDPERMAVCGDSAGGNLAAGVAIRAKAEGLVLALQALIYPCIDDVQDGYPSMTENATGYFLGAQDMTWFWDHYVPTEHRNNPRAVPARLESLINLAPAFVQTAEYDPLSDEGERYAHELEIAGVEVSLVRYPGVVHGFMARWSTMARGTVAMRDLGVALQNALSHG